MTDYRFLGLRPRNDNKKIVFPSSQYISLLKLKIYDKNIELKK